MGAKLKASAVLLVVFGLGIGAGMAWQVHRFHHKSARNVWGERRIALLKKELQLKPWQEETLREIIQDAHDRAEDIHDAADFDLAKVKAESVEEIQQLLTDEQRQQFNAIRARHHAKHHMESVEPQPQTGSEAKSS